jgi:hypothetical protein
MIKKRILILLISIISLFFSYFLVDFLIVKITLIQFLGIELINLTLNYLQDIHKKKLLKA